MDAILTLALVTELADRRRRAAAAERLATAAGRDRRWTPSVGATSASARRGTNLGSSR
jgi:hypothetical protein